MNCRSTKESVSPPPSRGSADERVKKAKANSKAVIALRPTVLTINGGDSAEDERGGGLGKVL